MKKLFGYLCIVVVMSIVACKTAPIEQQVVTEENEVVAGSGEVTIIIKDFGISGPDNDKRSYYRIFIDKIEIGRTEIGLESQVKKFATTVEPNSHLLRIEKYVLDEKKDKYIKVNNISQPKPGFFYFNNSDKANIEIEVTHTVDTHQAEYRIQKR